MQNSILTDLYRCSYSIGVNTNLTQASGGNISLKNGNLIWVKGSGQRLKDVYKKDIFIPLKMDKISNMSIELLENFDSFREMSINHNFSLQPSLETNFHVYFTHQIVIHVHSLGAVALSLIKSLRNNIEFKCLGRNIYSVPYAKPGKQLAGMIKKFCPADAEVILLQNHGAIFCGDDFGLIRSMIQDFESKAIRLLQDSFNFGTNMEKNSNIFSGGFVTPDQVVFMGPDSIKTLEDSRLKLISNQDIIDVALFYERVNELVSWSNEVAFLSSHDVSEIANWDREIARKEMSK